MIGQKLISLMEMAQFNSQKIIHLTEALFPMEIFI